MRYARGMTQFTQLPLDDQIKQLIANKKLANQAELVAALAQKGVLAHQSTVSRALHKMGVGKVLDPATGQAFYKLRAAANRYLATNLVHKLVVAEAMLVVFTQNGAAGHVCEYLDRQAHPAIAGTIAGENTIFIAPHKLRDMAKIEKFVRDVFL